MKPSRFAQGTITLAAVLGLSLAAAQTVQAAAVRTDSGFATNTLAANDDDSTGLVPLGFTANFFGTDYTQLYVNNNGNVTFTGPLWNYTPFNLLSTATPIIAPFFADVDTRYAGDPVRYGTSTIGSQAAFGVNWLNADYFLSDSGHTLSNDFQLVLIDRSDIGAGDFDIEFNYDQIQWETGDASDGANGLGGDSARAGYSNGLLTAYELAGSAVNGAFLAGGSNSLVAGSFNSNVSGRYLFEVRNGVVTNNPDSAVPEPGTLLLLGSGLVGLAGYGRKRRQA